MIPFAIGLFIFAARWWWLSEPPLGPVAIDDYLSMLAEDPDESEVR